MNELSTDVNYGEMKAELQALRKKVEDLESKQAAYKGGTDRTVRRRFPKRLVIASVSLAAMLVAGGLLWGQGAIQALFIDEKGNVGIGTTSPTVRLDVAGGPRAAFYPGTKQPISLTARALYVTGDSVNSMAWSSATVMEPRALASDMTLSMPRETTKTKT